MKYHFEGHFASRIRNFIAQKRVLGFQYNNEESCLYRFEKHCIEFFPNEDRLTQELCLSWATKRSTEISNSFRNRIAPIREFARYLNSIGESAYVITNKYGKTRVRLTPYIYPENEIAEIWNELDNIAPFDNYPLRHLIILAFVRLLYCCGLRPCEAERLMVKEIDLSTGKIYIRESKGHKDRMILMTDDVREYYCGYNKKISRFIPGRKFFFSNTSNMPYSTNNVRNAFSLTTEKLGIQKTGIATPRLYDFRHTFATHRLYRWLQEGKDLNVMLPYLRAYMGHAKLSATYYYLHLVLGQFETMSGLDFSRYEEMLPEVNADE
jgi:integrase